MSVARYLQPSTLVLTVLLAACGGAASTLPSTSPSAAAVTAPSGAASGKPAPSGSSAAPGKPAASGSAAAASIAPAKPGQIILSGALDGGLEGVPDNLQLEDKGFHPLFDMAALDLPANIVGIVANGAWLDSHRGEMQAYIDATVQAIAREKKDKSFAEGIIKKYLKIDDQRLLDASYDYTIAKVIPAIPYATPEQFKDTVATVAKRDPRAQTYDLSKLIDSSFLKSAADRGLDKA